MRVPGRYACKCGLSWISNASTLRAPAFAHQIQQRWVKRIAQKDTFSQLLCLLLRYLCGDSTCQGKSPVAVSVSAGNLSPLDFIAQIREEPPLHNAQDFIAADRFADGVESLHELSQDA